MGYSRKLTQKCRNCDKEFLLEDSKFCSLKCANAYITELEHRVIRAVKDNTSHTANFSKP